MNAKPLCLRLEEAENELNEAIVSVSSKHDLPCYLLEYIVSDLLTRVKNGKREEIARAKKSMEENGDGP